MQRFVLAFAAAFAACSAGALAQQTGTCRPAYVVPYAEQCDFQHASIKKDGSPRNVGDAYAACDRAQTEAGNCLASKVKQLHVIALSALYRSVSEEADIAMFAGQYRTAEALLGEKNGILDIAAREAKPGDPTIAAERAQTKTDLATSIAGQCMERAYLAGLPARGFAHDHRFKDLEKTLVGQYAQYTACANMEASQPKKAYVSYVALVELEESGRAAQAAGDRGNASKLFAACLSGVARVQNGSAETQRYLAVLTQLCKGRMNGTYRVDQPRPLDHEGEGFKPLALPAS